MGKIQPGNVRQLSTSFFKYSTAWVMGDPIVTEHGDTREEEPSFITETRDEDGIRSLHLLSVPCR